MFLQLFTVWMDPNHYENFVSEKLHPAFASYLRSMSGEEQPREASCFIFEIPSQAPVDRLWGPSSHPGF